MADKRAKFVYIEAADGTKLFLDSVEEVNRTQSNNITSYAMASGVTVSDHISADNTQITISGRISAVKIQEGDAESTSFDDFLTKLDQLCNSKTLFKVSYSLALPTALNCQFSSVSVVQNTSTGAVAADISLNITQLQIGQGVSIVKTPVALSNYSTTVAGKKSVNSGTLEPTEAERRTLGEMAYELNKQTYSMLPADEQAIIDKKKALEKEASK